MSNKLPQPEKRSGELTEYEFGFILDDTLLPKHRKDEKVLRYINCFVRCKNNAQAAYEAGLTTSQGYNIRHKMDVANCIQKIIDKSAMKYGFDASEIMERTREMMDFDPIQLQNADGTFKSNLHDIAPEARRNLKKLKVKNIWGEHVDLNGMKSKIIVGEVIEYEFYDKTKAIELAGKEMELFKTTTKVEHTVTKDMASILLAAAKRGESAAAIAQTPTPKTFETEVVDDQGSNGE